SVAVSGDHIAVGSRNSFVFTYKRDADGWTFMQALQGDSLEVRVDMEDDVLAVAKPGASVPDSPEILVGQVEIFELRDAMWDHVATFESSTPSDLDQFGYSMDLHDGVLAVANGYEWQ